MADHARLTFSTGNRWERAYGYSRAVRVGDSIVMTGTVSMNADSTPFVPDDAGAQATRCLEIIERSLGELGASRGDIVRTRWYVTDIARSDEFGRAHGEFFGGCGAGVGPCLTMVEVARLIDDAFLVEIEAEAIVGSARGASGV